MQKGIARITGMFNKLTKTSSKTQKALSRMTSGINFLVFDKVASYAARAGQTLRSMATTALKSVDAIGKLAKSTGISVEGLQAFSLAASDAGVDQVALSGAFGRMSKRLAEAAQGFGEALPALQRLGLSAADLIKLSPDEQFLKIGEAIGGLGTEGEKAAAAFKIFSDQGLRLVPLFDDIRKKTGAAQEELSQLGVLLSKREISNVESLNDSLSRVQKTLAGIVQKVVAELAPAVKLVADDWLGFVKGTDGALVDGIVGAFQEAALTAADWYDTVSAGINSVVDFFKNPPDWVQGLSQFAGEAGNQTKELGQRTAGLAAEVGGIANAYQGLAARAAAFLGEEGAAERAKAFEEEARILFKAQQDLVDAANASAKGIKAETEERKKQMSTRQKLEEQFARANKAREEARAKALQNLVPTVELSKTGGVIANFQKLVADALSSGTKEAAKNQLVGLDARSQAGLNFLLESGVAGKKPEEKTAKNTAEAVVLLRQIRDLDKVDLTVAIP